MEILHDDVMCRERLAKRAVEERKKEKKGFFLYRWGDIFTKYTSTPTYTHTHIYIYKYLDVCNQIARRTFAHGIILGSRANYACAIFLAAICITRLCPEKKFEPLP